MFSFLIFLLKGDRYINLKIQIEIKEIEKLRRSLLSVQRQPNDATDARPLRN